MKKLYIATAVITLLLALLVQFPARLAWQWFAADAAADNNVALAAPQGTLFEGDAAFITTQSLIIEQPQWDAHWLTLLTARLRYDINGSLADYPLQTELTLAPTGSISLADTRAAVPLSLVAPMLQLPVMPLAGLLSLDMQTLKLKDQRVLRADGVAQVRNARWLLLKPELVLGTLQANISTEDEVIIADLDSEGPLQLKGQARLKPDGQYEVDIRLRAGRDAEQRMRNMLNTLGQPQDGWYRIVNEGKIPGRS